MAKYTMIRAMIVSLFLAAPLTVALAACTNHTEGSMDGYVDEYDSQVSALRKASADHLADVTAAGSIEDVKDVETRYKRTTENILTDMNYVIGDMDGCHGDSGRRPNTTMMRDDVKAMRVMVDNNYEDIMSSVDMNAALNVESNYEHQLGSVFDQMAEHQRAMMSTSRGSTCGAMYDNGMMSNGDMMF